MSEVRECPYCAEEIALNAKKCKHCHEILDPTLAASMGGGLANSSDKKILPAFILCWFFGFLGVHRFYTGKVGTGIAMIFTFGGLGIWVLIDLINIVMGNFTDAEGNAISEWT